MTRTLLFCALFIFIGTNITWANDILCPVDLGADIDACEGQVIQLDGTVSDSGATYQWLFESPVGSGTFIPFSPPEINPTLDVTTDGVYMVEVMTPSTSCSDTVMVTFNPVPVDTGFFELVLCDDTINGSTSDDEISTFDLTSMEIEITDGDGTLMVIWYESAADESAGIPIADPTQYQNVLNPQTILYRVVNTLGCYYVKSFFLSVLPLPTPATPTPLIDCDFDADGFSEFDLHSKDVEIIDGEPDVNVLYFETLINAEMGNPIDALVSPYNNIVPFSQTVYARVTRDVPPAIVPCYTIVELELQAAPVPDEPDSSFINPLVVSDTDGDGIEAFDLTINDAAVIGIQSPSDFEPITHHTTLIDAEFEQNPILNADNFISSGQTIWVRLENLITGCYRITPFDIVVEGIILAQQPVDVFINEGDDNGQAIFDLTTQEAAMLGSLDPLVHQFTYHVSLSDSNNNENAIANPMAYQNIANPQTIYIRLTNTDNGFYALTNFQIETDGILGVESVLENLIALYPNPVNNEIHIQSSEALSNLEIRVYDMNGRLLVFETERGTIDHHRLDVSQFSNGMFWIEITSNGQRLVKPFVKE